MLIPRRIAVYSDQSSIITTQVVDFFRFLLIIGNNMC